jgi:spore germination protein YaaH
MLQKTLIIWAGIIAGAFLGYFLVTQTNTLNIGEKNSSALDVFKAPKKVVIGFLPYWLINKAQADYSSYITQLSYFNVTIDSNGSIQRYTSPGESDPGWHALYSGKVDDYLANAKSKGIDLSLTVFSGDDEKIDKFLENPAESAQNLINDIGPVISQYGFTDINLDIERVAESTPDQRNHYTSFVSEIRNRLNPNITITLDAPGIAFVKDKNLADPKSLAKIVDYIVLMGYDFHNPGSFVTGPVAPESGAGIVSEFDIESAVQAALTLVPAQKLILAVPLYGYSWESLNSFPRAAILPGSAYSISSRSVEELLAECATCSAVFDKTDSESHVIYKDTETGTYHQIFYPDKASTDVKVNFVKSQNLGGIALWALGYEGSTILEPLAGYRR